jgi:hypothetical protein
VLDLHAGGVVAVCYDHDTGFGAKMQVPELMTGRKRCYEQLRRIPSRRIAAELEVLYFLDRQIVLSGSSLNMLAR